MSSVSGRGEIDDAYKWDLSALYTDEEAWEADFQAVQDRLDDLRAFEGQTTADGETLLAILELREEVMRTVANVSAYARMRRDEDTTDQDAQALAARAQTLSAEASSAASFIEPELQQADRDTLETLAADEPELETYEHYFDDVLRLKSHTRSPEVEELLAELSEVTGAAGEVYDTLANADMEFPAVDDPDGEPRRITLSNFTTLQKEPDRAFRRRVYEAFYDEWETIRNAVGTAYENTVRADIKLAQARAYDSAREAVLDRNNIPVAVYDALVETVRDNIDVLHRHAELKRDRLGVEDLQMWDLYAPMRAGEAPTIPYEQAVEYVTAAVAPLGEAYQSRLAAGLDSRWVDVYETPNKRSGAYSGGTYDSEPYVLMNYQDDVASMFTLAHELGHAMHSEFSSEAQPYVYSDYGIFVAEVASTVNETLLTHHLLETVEDDQLRRHVLDEYLERFRSTLLRQTMFAEFEQRTHEHSADGGALTPDWLDACYRELKAAYYEPAVLDDRIAREWMRIPHFYYGFYVYQYATGISAAVALVEGILAEGEPTAERYRTFLRTGSREYPLDALQLAGVDLTTPEPVQAALEVYDEYRAEFAALA